MTDAPRFSPDGRWAYYPSAPYPCPYLPNQTAQAQVVLPWGRWQPTDYAELIERGFRRSAEQLYAPACPTCRACLSLRIPVAQFRPDRTQRRTWQRLSASLTAREVPLAFFEEHYVLYRRYTAGRHRLTDEERSETAYRQGVLLSPFDTRLVEFRDPAGALKIVSLIDVLPDALSAVYTWFEPQEPRASFGTYAILWQIAQARRVGMRYLYLGYWIAASRTMAYKARFRPFETFWPGHSIEWQRHETLLDDRKPQEPR